MFGLFYAFFQGVAGIASAIHYSNEEKKSKKRTYNPIDQTYIDSKGRIHDMKSGLIVHIGRSPSGDHLLENILKDYKRNLSQEERDRRYEFLKNHPQKGVTATEFHNDYNYNSGIYKANNMKIAAGKYYRDLLSDAILIEREFKIENVVIGKSGNNEVKTYLYLKFYIDSKTGKILRLADGERNNRRNNYMKNKIDGIKGFQGDVNCYLTRFDIKVEEFIQKFNLVQNDRMDKFKKKKPYMDDYEISDFYSKYYYNNNANGTNVLKEEI